MGEHAAFAVDLTPSIGVANGLASPYRTFDRRSLRSPSPGTLLWTARATKALSFDNNLRQRCNALLQLTTCLLRKILNATRISFRGLLLPSAM